MKKLILIIILCPVYCIAGTLHFTWQANSSAEQVTGYRVYYSQTSGTYENYESVTENLETKTSRRNATYKWTESTTQSGEFYCELSDGGDPSITEPDRMWNSTDIMTEATVGSLSVETWDYGDNDTLGYSTLYIRITDAADPDTLDADAIQSSVLTDPVEHTSIYSFGVGQWYFVLTAVNEWGEEGYYSDEYNYYVTDDGTPAIIRFGNMGGGGCGGGGFN